SSNSSSCEPADPADTVTDRLNTLLKSSGEGYTLTLCQGEQYILQAPLYFTAPNQEIMTEGYPTGDERAILVVDGPVYSNGTGHTTAIIGTDKNCGGAKVRSIQINGTRLDGNPISGGANIEMGGPNANHVIEYVRSYDPRSWSCMHVDEGSLNCTNATVQYNDVGPCGHDTFQHWADGISLSCRSSTVRHNMVHDATDGGIVVFGSPGSQVYNNTIWVVNSTLLGGINMVDYLPFDGDYAGTVVHNNTILGGFADEGVEEPDETKGVNEDDAIIKIGIAIGPRTWFGDEYGSNVSSSGTVHGNRFSGAFSYGIVVNSAKNFTVLDNDLFGNLSFIGARGTNCSDTETLPSPAAFIVERNTTASSNLQSNFTNVTSADSLTCVLPPDGGDYWPYGGNPSAKSGSTSHSSGLSGGAIAGAVIGVLVGVAALGVACWFIRRWAMNRREAQRYFKTSRRSAF
ncbi:hypothetical protein FISHEDRAFT_25752, partial [Fistulina hepatica ATCC 64428]